MIEKPVKVDSYCGEYDESNNLNLDYMKEYVIDEILKMYNSKKYNMSEFRDEIAKCTLIIFQSCGFDFRFKESDFLFEERKRIYHQEMDELRTFVNNTLLKRFGEKLPSYEEIEEVIEKAKEDFKKSF